MANNTTELLSLLSKTTAKLETKIDKAVDGITSINTVLVKQQATLDDHVRRTELLEEQTAFLKAELSPISQSHRTWSLIGKGLVSLVVFGSGVAEIIRAFWK